MYPAPDPFTKEAETTAEKKFTQQRLSPLELAEALGSVSEACRRRGISRTRFYEHMEALQQDLDRWLIF